MNNYQHDEYQAWLTVVKALKQAGVDINQNNSLNDAIKEWGWQYHCLLSNK